MRNTLFVSAAAAFVTFAGAARADQWTAADAAFAAREGNRAKIAEARTAYNAILDAATSEGDKLRAASQLGRLAIFEGEMTVAESDTASKKAIFGECWQTIMPKIKPGQNGVGENPAYYYFNGVCTAYWGKAAGPLASLPHIAELKALIAGGQTQDQRFEGGGIYRLMAGIYSNKAAIAVGLYRPDDALAAAKNAVLQAAYPGDPSGGADYYDNWRGLALTQDEKGLKADAISTLTDKIAELQDLADNSALPPGREPEAKWNLQKMKDHLAALQAR